MNTGFTRVQIKKVHQADRAILATFILEDNSETLVQSQSIYEIEEKACLQTHRLE